VELRAGMKISLIIAVISGSARSLGFAVGRGKCLAADEILSPELAHQILSDSHPNLNEYSSKDLG